MPFSYQTFLGALRLIRRFSQDAATLIPDPHRNLNFVGNPPFDLLEAVKDLLLKLPTSVWLGARFGPVKDHFLSYPDCNLVCAFPTLSSPTDLGNLEP